MKDKIEYYRENIFGKIFGHRSSIVAYKSKEIEIIKKIHKIAFENGFSIESYDEHYDPIKIDSEINLIPNDVDLMPYHIKIPEMNIEYISIKSKNLNEIAKIKITSLEDELKIDYKSRDLKLFDNISKTLKNYGIDGKV